MEHHLQDPVVVLVANEKKSAACKYKAKMTSKNELLPDFIEEFHFRQKRIIGNPFIVEVFRPPEGLI